MNQHNTSTHAPASALGRTMMTVAIVVAALIAIGLPFTLNPYQIYVASLWLAISTAGLGLMMLIGQSGQIALAQPAFVGIGAYGTAYLAQHGWPWAGACVGAAIIASAAGLLIGLPATRLKGFYLAIATLAFGDLVQHIFVEAGSITGGVAGLAVTPLSIAGLSEDASRWYLSLTIVLLVVVVMLRLRNTGFGRRLKLIRDGEIAAASLEISATRTKLVVFAASALIGALSGSAYAQTVEYLTPSGFGMSLMLQLLVVVFIGGVTYVSGPFLGAAVVIVLRELMQDFGQWQNVVYGLTLALVIAFLPEGLASLPSKFARRRSSREASGAPPLAVVQTEQHAEPATKTLPGAVHERVAASATVGTTAIGAGGAA